MPEGWRDGEWIPLVILLGVFTGLGLIYWVIQRLDRTRQLRYLIPMLLAGAAVWWWRDSLTDTSSRSFYGGWLAILFLAIALPMWWFREKEPEGPRRRRRPR